jgi:phosphatidate phosphatase APP1
LQTILDDAWQGAQGYRFSGRLTHLRRSPRARSSRLAALYRTGRMLLTHGEKGLVTLRVADHEWTVRADDHGYWEFAGNRPLALPPGWHALEAEPVASSPAGLLVVDPRNPLGLISDLDDTVLLTGVLRKRTLLRNSLTVPPERRTAVPGMAALFQKILQGNPAPEASAVFYLSSSPRQLTDNLRRFLAVRGFPRGVLQLRKISREGGDATRDHLAYKLRRLGAILAACPGRRFHFFGDDAESDPEVYAQVREKHPDQIAGIWIRRVNPDKQRPAYPDQRDVRELIS